jgi:hypothetical protein
VKLRKKTAMVLSFTLGSLMFASTAMAEVMSKSGYDQLKDALKFTADGCSSTLKNYTMDYSLVLKDNDKILESVEQVNKYDLLKKAFENTNKNVDNIAGTSNEGYYYSDENCVISHSNNDENYYESDYEKKVTPQIFDNPFRAKEAGDIEKIVDAFVGNLKDYVVVKDNSDGSKELSGSLNESQIPTLADALVSYELKNELNNSYRNSQNNPNAAKNLVFVTKDIYVKEVKGKAVIDKTGLIQSILGTGVVSGRDDKDKEHNYTFEILGKLVDVNSTTVSKPDLKGKTVQKSVQNPENQFSFGDKNLGLYKSDIIIQKDNKFVKIGESFINITKVQDKTVYGIYHEEYAKAYESYAKIKGELSIEAKFDKNPYNSDFTLTDSSSKKLTVHISIPPDQPEIYFNIDNMNVSGCSGRYLKVLDYQK